MASRTQEKIKNYSKDSKASFEYTKRAGELSLLGPLPGNHPQRILNTKLRIKRSERQLFCPNSPFLARLFSKK
jgi:hypothetical protein